MDINRSKLVFMLVLMVAAPGCAASDSMRDMSKGASQVVKGSARGALGSVKVVASVMAVPLVSVGAVAHVSLDAGEAMLHWATGTEDKPLPIGKETVTVGPSPKEALQDPEKI